MGGPFAVAVGHAGEAGAHGGVGEGGLEADADGFYAAAVKRIAELGFGGRPAVGGHAVACSGGWVA